MKGVKILVTAASGNLGRCLAYYFNKSNFSIVVADCKQEFLAASKSKARYLIPPARSLKYLPVINKIIKKERVDLIFFQSDIEIRKAAANLKKIKTKVWLPEYKYITKTQDKFYCNQLWQKAGISVPWSVVIKNKSQLQANTWLRPLKFIGGGATMAFHAVTKKQAQDWLDQYQGWGNFTISEFLPGRMFGFDSLWHQGKLMGYLLKERLVYSQTDSNGVVKYSTSTVRTVNNKKVVDTAIRAIKAVCSQPDGLFAADLRENKSGIACPTEINAGRFMTTSLLLMAEIGYDLPLDYIKLALDKKVKPRKPYQKTKYLYFVKGLTRLLNPNETKIINLISK